MFTHLSYNIKKIYAPLFEQKMDNKSPPASDPLYFSAKFCYLMITKQPHYIANSLIYWHMNVFYQNFIKLNNDYTLQDSLSIVYIVRQLLKELPPVSSALTISEQKMEQANGYYGLFHIACLLTHKLLNDDYCSNAYILKLINYDPTFYETNLRRLNHAERFCCEILDFKLNLIITEEDAHKISEKINIIVNSQHNQKKTVEYTHQLEEIYELLENLSLHKNKKPSLS